VQHTENILTTYRVTTQREAFTKFWWGNLRERNHWEGPGIDGRIILRWVFKK
jgi:hypothetical protein